MYSFSVEFWNSEIRLIHSAEFRFVVSIHIRDEPQRTSTVILVSAIYDVYINVSDLLIEGSTIHISTVSKTIYKSCIYKDFTDSTYKTK
jgi:hypothetical protein